MTTPEQDPREGLPTETVYLNPTVVITVALLVVGFGFALAAAFVVYGTVGVLTVGAAWCTALGLLLLGVTGGTNGATAVSDRTPPAGSSPP